MVQELFELLGYIFFTYWLNSETPNEEVPLLSTCAPPPAAPAPAPPMLPKIQATMPLGTPNLHQRSMVTPGPKCKPQNPNPKSQTQTQNPKTPKP